MADKVRKGDQEFNLVDKATQTPVQVTAAGELKTTAATGLPAELNLFISSFLLNGSSPSMRVNGSTTPVEFVFNADATDSIFINEIKFMFVCPSLRFDGDTFGKNQSILTNGIKLEVRSKSVTTQIANFRTNEDFIIQSNTTSQLERDTTGDFLTAVFNLGNTVELVGGSGDFIKVTVRDSLTSVDYEYLRARFTGFKDI